MRIGVGVGGTVGPSAAADEDSAIGSTGPLADEDDDGGDGHDGGDICHGGCRTVAAAGRIRGSIGMISGGENLRRLSVAAISDGSVSRGLLRVGCRLVPVVGGAGGVGG